MMPEIGRVMADRYEITEKIGSGGMSIVYKAIDRKLNRPVSLKVLREEYSVDEEFRKRFIREARSVASLSHQNIVNVYDVGQENETNYIIMEYIAGMTLKELITKRAPFSDQEVLGVAIQMAAALIHAHNSKIIHRDIKPQNVIVTGKGVIKVTDFGIARKADSSSVTMAGSTTLGSVHYFSPEQAKGGKADPKSDLYSLGIVMYEMLTGELPFDADTAVSVALMQINEPLPDVHAINPNVNPKVVKIVEKLTEKTPEYRYQQAESLLKDLRAIIANPGAVLSFEGDDVPRVKPRYKDDMAEPYGGLDGAGEDLEEDPYEEMDADDGDIDDGYVRETHDDEYDDEGGGIYGGAERGRGHYHRADDDGYHKESDGKRDRNIVLAGVLTALVLVVLACVFVLPNLFKDLFPGPTETPPQMVTLPEIVGRDVEMVRAELAALNVNLVVQLERPDSEIPAGVIIDCDILDDRVNPGDDVNVIVSTGVEMEEVPSFVGMDVFAAIAYVEAHNLPFLLNDTSEFAYNDEYKTGVIFDQSPKSGTQAAYGTEIILHISKGPALERIEVPKLTDITLTRARDMIEGLGLRVGDVQYRYDDRISKDIVMVQTVAPGSFLMTGDSINLVVSNGPAPPTETDEPSGTDDPDEPGETNQPGVQSTITPLPSGYTSSPTPSAPPSPTATVYTGNPNFFPPGVASSSPTPTSTQGTYVPPPTGPLIISTDAPPVLPTEGRTLYIDIIDIEKADVYEVEVMLVKAGVGQESIFKQTVGKDEFPFQIPVTGTGVMDVYIYYRYNNETTMNLKVIDFN